MQKVVRDNDEDNFLREQNPNHRRRNTSAFTFLSWAGFLLAVLFQFVGLSTLEEPLYVVGYYAIASVFLIVSCLVLQKTIRDNEEDNLNNSSFSNESN
ncbi:YiaA/YiaB family inner membrane protein [Cohnella sp.]|uniref:YiaA/YiaB family inner membrane protein n=1 Tax=Cohnella sp. TaxID=1883426 RepID=UPI003567B854